MTRSPEHLKTYAERISYVLETFGNNSEVARTLGITRSAVGQWKTTTANIKPDNLFGLQKLTGFSAQWIITGEPPIYSKEGLSREDRDWLDLKNQLTDSQRRAFRELVASAGQRSHTDDDLNTDCSDSSAKTHNAA